MTIADIITETLETYLEINNDESFSPTYFHTRRPPSISLNTYLKRLEAYMKCSDETFILALIYLDRVTAKQADFSVNIYSIHRVFLAALVVAAKYSDDKYYKNSYYSRVGGISNSELNTLEHQFLILIDFHLFVSSEEFEKYLKVLNPSTL